MASSRGHSSALGNLRLDSSMSSTGREEGEWHPAEVTLVLWETKPPTGQFHVLDREEGEWHPADVTPVLWETKPPTGQFHVLDRERGG